MARARNIKPGFFVNEDLADCDPMARLLFISLWMLADREGRLENRPKKIKMQTFPYDDCDIESLLKQLSDHSFIFTYSAFGKSIIQINNWSKHQNPHHKEVCSELPRYDKSKHELTTTQSKVMHDPNTVCDSYIPMSLTIRTRIFERDGCFCNYCKSTEDLEIDHIIPVSRGGNSIDSNLQVLCKNCNLLKFNHLVNQELSIANGRVMLDSSLDQYQSNQIASCPTDSLLLIPDSPILNPDCGIPESPTAPPATPKKIELDYSSWPEQPSQQVMTDWLAMRKRLKANVSQTVINRFATELHKARTFGYTVDQCLAECVTRNWRGFEVQWILNSKQHGAAKPNNGSAAKLTFTPTDYENGINPDGSF